MKLRILALEAYYGGSHRAFLDALISESGHDWTLLTLPPNKWKWRMRHSAVTFVEQVSAFDRTVDVAQSGCIPRASGQNVRGFEVIFASAMLNLAEFLGLAPAWVRELPTVAYFHENQLTYPVRHEDERDYHFNFMNITTGLAADAVWFNSAYHRAVFLTAARRWLKKMPDFVPLDAIAAIERKSFVYHPGVRLISAPSGGVVKAEVMEAGMHIVWAARWEHDKDPELFFAALAKFKKCFGGDFRLSVIGESFRESPAVFAEARERFADEIVNWGYAESRAEYEGILSSADVLVSTAAHEFFGITVVEAMGAGVFPLVPRGLAYPEVVGSCIGEGPAAADCFHDSTAREIALKLSVLGERKQTTGSVWLTATLRARMLAAVKARYEWPVVAQAVDAGLSKLSGCEEKEK